MRLPSFFFLLMGLVGSVTSCTSSPQDTTHSSPADVATHTVSLTDTVRHAAVVTDHPEATRIGDQILRKGGNAVDAAIAVHFALAVCYPYAGSLGAGGFMVIRTHDGEARTLDFREVAPAAATEKMFLDAQGKVIPDLSVNGHKASGVPGMVDGMVKAHEAFGTLPWADLVQPAIDLARNGFPVTAIQARQFNDEAADFARFSKDAQYLKKSTPWKTGDKLVQEDLAKSLERIRDKGREGFYAGETAILIEQDMKRNGGLILVRDLAAYQAKWRDPLQGRWRDYEITTMGPPSSGGIILLQLLRMTDAYPLESWGWGHPYTVHVIAEAERRVFADRATHLGDPDFWKVPVGGLLDSTYLRTRMQGVTGEGKATPSAQVKAGTFSHESDETTHFSIVDEKGNAVAVTTTINAPYGSKVYIRGTGIIMNNEMDDFAAAPGVPNLFGVIGGEANAIHAGKKPLSSMTPVIITRNGKIFLVAGSPGGSTIPTSVFQTVLQVTRFGKDIQKTVEAKRFHHQWLPDKIQIEEGCFTPENTFALELKGHTVSVRGEIGDVLAIHRLPDGTLQCGIDPRRDAAGSAW